MVNGSRYLLPITRLLVYLSTRQLVYLSTRQLVYSSTCLLVYSSTCLLIIYIIMYMPFHILPSAKKASANPIHTEP